MFRMLLLTLMLMVPAKSYAWDLTSSLGDIATPQNELSSVGDRFSNDLPFPEHEGDSAMAVAEAVEFPQPRRDDHTWAG